MRTALTRSRLRFAAAVLAIWCGVPARSLAQSRSATLDFGAAAMRFSDSVRSNGATVTPAVLLAWPRATLGASLTFAQFASGWSSHGIAGGSVFSTPLGPAVLELAGTGGGSIHPAGSNTHQVQAVARTHLMRARSGAWGGVGGGRAHDGLASRGVVLAELGAWANAGSRSALATLSPTVVDDSLRFADAQVAARWLLSRGEVGAVLGYRAGDGLTSTIGENRAWGNASVTLWLTRAVALVGSAGNYPTDFTQGFPGGRFASISVRLASAGARPVTVAHGSRSTAVEQAERSATLDFAVARLPGGMQRFDVHAPGARRVEIMGDFSDWTPLVLRDAGKGRWTTTVPVARGTHQLNLRLDGGAWMVPPGLPILRDEFGGAVGLLSIQ